MKVAEKLFRDGHAAAVFEAARALNNRVKAMSGLATDGAGMMGDAFNDKKPSLVVADLSTQTGKDEQSGYRFLFMGSQQASRNPAAHEPFGQMDDDEAFELLGLASHLMRKLDAVIGRCDSDRLLQPWDRRVVMPVPVLLLYCAG